MPSSLDVQMMTLLSAPPDANLLPVINKRLQQHIYSAINRHKFIQNFDMCNVNAMFNVNGNKTPF